MKEPIAVQDKPNVSQEHILVEELGSIDYVPLLAIEKKLIAGTLITGFSLLLIMVALMYFLGGR
jgi:hypothetical protein